MKAYIQKAGIIGTILVALAIGQLSVTAASLNATRYGTSVALSWLPDATNEFYLQVSTNLADPTGWQIVTNPTVLAGGNYCVTNDSSGASQFYRLKAWETLFNGTSTDAFRGYRQSTFPSNDWIITASGELKTVTGSPSGHIITIKQYADFELLWEWKTGARGNSGVLYRATESYDSPWKSAPEYQLVDDAYYSLPGDQASGAVYRLFAPTNKVLMPTGQWNQCRLLVQGNHVEHWLNGRKIVEYELNSLSFNALVASSSYYNPYSQFAKARQGYIAFQNWTPEIWFRNIKVRTLPAQ